MNISKPLSSRIKTSLSDGVDRLTSRVGGDVARPMLCLKQKIKATDKAASHLKREINAMAMKIESRLGNNNAGPEYPGLDLNKDNAPTIYTDGGDSSEKLAEHRDLLNLVTQETRANIIQNILGHHCTMPSPTELDYYNPSKSKGTISGHIDKLVDAGVLMRVVIPQGERQRDYPDTFVTLTDKGYNLLEEHSLFVPAIDDIKRDHERVEKTNEIKKYEFAPRPTVNVDYDHPLSGDGISVVEPDRPDEKVIDPPA